MAEISDGRLYSSNDMVRADCGGCVDCHACCCGMGTSIVLDPMDVAVMTAHLHCRFEDLLQERVELNIADGLILPNLAMKGAEEACTFLDRDGRCSIHHARPGICRLFPLGRYYADGGFKYFLQIHECKKENRGKIKVHKWLDVPDLKCYEQFVVQWHYFLNAAEACIQSAGEEGLDKKLNMYILNMFYVTPYDSEKDFYMQFSVRLAKAKRELCLL